MENNLKHSIYLRENNNIEDEHEELAFLNNSEEISKQDLSASINQSAVKKPIVYRPFESAFMTSCTVRQNKNAREVAENTVFKHVEEFQNSNLQKILGETQKNRIHRLCNSGFKIYFRQACEMAVAPIDQSLIVKQKAVRKKLSQNYQKRQKQRISIFKERVIQRTNREMSDGDESSIQQQNELEKLLEKQEKINSFLKRQQYYARQKNILRQMRQFCTYGAIKMK